MIHPKVKLEDLNRLDKFYIQEEWCSVQRIPMIKVGPCTGLHIFTNGIRYPETYGMGTNQEVYKLPDDYLLEQGKTVEIPQLTFDDLAIGDNYHTGDNLLRVKISPTQAVIYSNQKLTFFNVTNVKVIKL